MKFPIYSYYWQDTVVRVDEDGRSSFRSDLAKLVQSRHQK
jgi:hypothetical protein